MALKSKLQGKPLKKAPHGKMDIVFLSLVLVLLTVGLIMLFSSGYPYSYTHYGNSYHFIVRQARYAVIGVALMLGLSRFPYQKLRKLSWPAFAVSILMLGFLLVMPPMLKGTDVKRWIAIGSFSFQPTEIAKFSVILLFSHLITSNYKQMGSVKVVGVLLAILAVTCGLVVAEPHISATLLILLIGILLMVIGGMKWLHVGILGLVGVGGVAALLLSGVVSYSSDRIQCWLDPWSDPMGGGYQVIQSLLAIGSGGIMGRGLGKSRQKYLWVPEPQNDFIFSIVCEELGIIGAIIIVLLFCALVWRGFTIAIKAKDKFGCLMAVGLTFQVGLQAILNIMVVTNTIPNTGISLPFFSYGGTSLVLLLAQMGIVLSISRDSTIQKT